MHCTAILLYSTIELVSVVDVRYIYIYNYQPSTVRSINRMSKETQGQQYWNRTARKKRQGLKALFWWIYLFGIFFFVFFEIITARMPHFPKKHREDRKLPKYAGEVPNSTNSWIHQIIPCHHYQSISKIEPLSAGKRKQEEGDREIYFEFKHHCRPEKEAHTHTKRERESNEERGSQSRRRNEKAVY